MQDHQHDARVNGDRIFLNELWRHFTPNINERQKAQNQIKRNKTATDPDAVISGKLTQLIKQAHQHQLNRT